MRAHFENENVCADVIKFDQSLSDKLGNNWALGWRQMLREGWSLVRERLPRVVRRG